jgi:hypothetical protein
MNPGVEDGDEFPASRIDRRQIRSLEPVAVGAGQRKILRLVASAVLPGSNVLDMEPEDRCGGLQQPAVFAPVACPLPYRCARGGVHQGALFLCKNVRALACKMVAK